MTPEQLSILEGAQQRVRYCADQLNEARNYLFRIESEIAATPAIDPADAERAKEGLRKLGVA